MNSTKSTLGNARTRTGRCGVLVQAGVALRHSYERRYIRVRYIVTLRKPVVLAKATHMLHTDVGVQKYPAF